MAEISMHDFKHLTEAFLLYTRVKDDPIVVLARDMADLLSREDGNSGERLKQARRLYYQYAALLIAQAEQFALSGNLFHQHLCRLFLIDENPFSLACEQKTLSPKSTLYTVAMQDMRAFRDLIAFDIGIFSRYVGQNENLTEYIPNNTAANPYIEEIRSTHDVDQLIDAFRLCYEMLGCGLLAEYTMLRYADGRLAGVKSADTARFDDLIGYAEQKTLLRGNTEAFLKGLPANNMLLAGAHGTGKSSCVKALANEYFGQKLRIVELAKEQLADLPDVLAILSERGHSFLLYIDDLTFDDTERQYKHLQSVLEGGVVRKPKNVLFCATSNLRYNRQENTDTRGTETYLADRFGITITFPQPSPHEYFHIVSSLAKRENLDVSDDFLKEQSAVWEQSQKSLSGRAARQFLDHVICELNKE